MIKVKLLKDISQVKRFNTGAVIVRDGDAGDEMFILLKGQVGVYKNHRKPNEVLLTTLTPGSFFGETTIFMQRSRVSTVVAQENVILLAIDGVNARKFFFSEYGGVTHPFIQTLCERITASVTTCESLKTPSSRTVHRNAFFPEVNRRYFLPITKRDENYIQKFSTDSVILSEGVKTDKIYVVVRGSAGVYSNYRKPDEVRTAEIKPGNFFGMMNFHDCISSVTVVADSELTTISLNSNNIAAFFKYEPQAYLIVQMLCEQIDTLNKTQETLIHNKMNSTKHNMTNDRYKRRSLFPDNHKRYNLLICAEQSVLQSTSFTCPVCENHFSAITENKALLEAVAEDEDLRLHYDGVEPIYYAVVTCPRCWYSALQEYFNEGSAMEDLFNSRIQPYTEANSLNPQGIYNINDVFTRYYLALLCAAHCFFPNKELNLAKLRLRLSWIYKDCNDKEMAMFNAGKAHEHFIRACNVTKFSPAEAQSIYITTGVLCKQAGDNADAETFLTRAKDSKIGTDEHKKLAQSLLAKYGF